MKHNLSKTRIYRIYSGMKQRCYNPKLSQYKRYGGRGIKICSEWLGPNGFINFYTWAVANGYQDTLTIDRKNNNDNYCPENCQWITLSENSSKAQRSKYLDRKYSYKPILPKNYSSSIKILLKNNWIIIATNNHNALLCKGDKKVVLPVIKDVIMPQTLKNYLDINDNK